LVDVAIVAKRFQRRQGGRIEASGCAPHGQGRGFQQRQKRVVSPEWVSAGGIQPGQQAVRAKAAESKLPLLDEAMDHIRRSSRLPLGSPDAR